MITEPNKDSGEKMHFWATELFPICRSITGPGVRETLDYIAKLLPGLEIKSVPSGDKVFDWTVPDEWSIHEAYVEDSTGNRIIDFSNHNLHVVGYSTPVDEWMDLDSLQKHLYSIPDQPDAIPYITSYYTKRWGFCLAQKQRDSLQQGQYHAVIRSKIEPGRLNFGELLIPGDSDEEIFISTYICHPSMANNELSGPVVTTALAQWISNLKERKYTYRIVFIPETIGSITYLSKNIETLKKKVVAGFNVTCIGDERCYSFLPSRAGNTISDQAARHVLGHIDPNYKKYLWLDRGSDERQYCAPGVDLPIATIMRSKYGEYPEYHTSLDDLQLVTPDGLLGGLNALTKSISVIENNCYPCVTVYCEPQLGKRGLYPTLSTKGSGKRVRAMMDLISYSDGALSLLEVADKIGEPFEKLLEILSMMTDNGLIEALPKRRNNIT